MLTNVVLMLDQRQRRWPDINTTLGRIDVTDTVLYSLHLKFLTRKLILENNITYFPILNIFEPSYASLVGRGLALVVFYTQ